MKKKSILIVLALIAVAAAAVMLARRSVSPTEAPAATTTPSVLTYSNPDIGLAFTYPDTYHIDARDTGSPQRGRYTITLIDQDDYDALILSERSEGPTAITLDVFQNNLDQTPPIGWIRGTNDSNYKLGDGVISTTSIPGAEAFRYRWSGLYEGESVVFEHGGNMVMASVTFMTPDDPIRTAFERVLSSLTLTDPKPLSKEEAINYLKGMYPELNKYPSENLPPRFIETEEADDAWFLAFETRGSGLPYVLDAVCYKVGFDKRVQKTGEYTHDPEQGAEKLDAETCDPE